MRRMMNITTSDRNDPTHRKMRQLRGNYWELDGAAQVMKKEERVMVDEKREEGQPELQLGLSGQTIKTTKSNSNKESWSRCGLERGSRSATHTQLEITTDLSLS